MKRTLLLPLLVLASCASVPPNYSSPTGAIGELAVVDGIGVRPLAILEDSRCPASVQCVWAGRVRIRAEISGAGTREMTLMEPIAVGGGTVTLVDVQPPKLAPGATQPSDYRFTFRFQR